MSTITNNRSKQIAKYLKVNRGEVKLSIGSLAIYERPLDFPHPPRDEFGFFNTD